MPVTLTPYDENKTILIYKLVGNWSWTEFNTVDDDVWDHFERTDQRIDLIFDFMQSNQMPLGIGEIMKRAGRRTAPAHRGLGVVVKPPMILPIILRALQRVHPVAASIYRTADTQKEAIDLINESRGQENS